MGNRQIQNLPNSWIKLATRMYQISLENQASIRRGCLQVISVSVLVDASGRVVSYIKPRCEPLEPKDASERLLGMLTRTE